MKLNELISTVFLLGKIPIAPGTVGSLATIIFFYAFLLKSNIYILLLIIFLTFILALFYVSAYTKGSMDKDKSEIVIDEVIGQLISLTPIIWYKDSLNDIYIFILLTFFLLLGHSQLFLRKLFKNRINFSLIRRIQRVLIGDRGRKISIS